MEKRAGEEFEDEAGPPRPTEVTAEDEEAPEVGPVLPPQAKKRKV
jgi:hypothetical protein